MRARVMGGLFLVVCALLGAGSANAYFGAPGAFTPVLKSQNSSPYGYYEYLPPQYSETSGKRFGVVIFLHGVDEVGNGNSQLPDLLIPPNTPVSLLSNGKSVPVLVFSPQSPYTYWNKTNLNTFINYIYSAYPAADPDRLYVTGLSMGAQGVWEYASAYPQRIAAMVPIAYPSSSNPSRSQLNGVPIWAFHSFDDAKAYYKNSSGAINSVTPSSVDILSGWSSGVDRIATYSHGSNTHSWRAGSVADAPNADQRILFTLFAVGGHGGAWERAYSSDATWNWMIAWKKGGTLLPDPETVDSSPSPSPSPSPTQPVNQPPTISVPSGARVAEGETLEWTASIQDPEGAAISYREAGLPSFATVVSSNDRERTYRFSPSTDTVEQDRTFSFTLFASDGTQEVSATVSVVVTNVVSGDTGRTAAVKLSFHSSGGQAAPSPWNNFVSNGALGASLTSLMDQNGARTTVSATVTAAFTGGQSVGGPSASTNPEFPKESIAGYWYASSGRVAKIRFSGLDPARVYRFRMIAARSGVTGSRISVFRVGSESVELQAVGNTGNEAVLANLTPSAAGELVLEVQAKDSASQYGYLNALILE